MLEKRRPRTNSWGKGIQFTMYLKNNTWQGKQTNNDFNWSRLREEPFWKESTLNQVAIIATTNNFNFLSTWNVLMKENWGGKEALEIFGLPSSTIWSVHGFNFWWCVRNFIPMINTFPITLGIRLQSYAFKKDKKTMSKIKERAEKMRKRMT